jgi:penicillin-binding protein 1A
MKFGWIGKAFCLGIATLSGTTAIVALSLGIRYSDMPSVDSITNTQSSINSTIVDGAGRSVKQLYSDCYTVSIPKNFDDKNLRTTLILSEDSTFEDNYGVSLPSIARAVLANLEAGKVVQGSSTLTMQYLSMVLKKYPKYVTAGSAEQKIMEILLALKMSQYLTKDTIFTGYIQRVPVARGMCGFASYMKQMYKLEPSKAKLEHIVMFVSGLPGPSIYDPIANPAAAKQQRDTTIKKIIANGVKQRLLTKAEVKAYQAILGQSLPKAYIPNYRSSDKLDWGTSNIVAQVTGSMLPSVINNDGLTITGTSDPKIQAILDKSVNRWESSGELSGLNINLIVVDAASMSLLGNIGGTKPYGIGNTYDGSTQSRVPPGSVGKIGLYTALLQRRLDTNSFFTNFSWIRLRQPSWPLKGPTKGFMSLDQAFKDSVNTAAVSAQIEMEGFQRTLDLYKSLGINFPTDSNSYGYIDPSYQSNALGTYGMTLPEIAVVVGAIVNNGQTIDRVGLHGTPVTAIKQVKDRNGKTLYSNSDDNLKQVISPQVCQRMIELMRLVVTSGTGKAANISSVYIIGKTGTNEGNVVNFVAAAYIKGRWIVFAGRAIGDIRGRFGGTFIAPKIAEIIKEVVDLEGGI